MLTIKFNEISSCLHKEAYVWLVSQLKIKKMTFQEWYTSCSLPVYFAKVCENHFSIIDRDKVLQINYVKERI